MNHKRNILFMNCELSGKKGEIVDKKHRNVIKQLDIKFISQYNPHL